MQAFVNFCNIQNAIKAIGAMKNHPDYQTTKISYGKDRCGNPPRSVLQHVQAQSAVMPSRDGLVSTPANAGLGVSLHQERGPQTIPA